MNEKPLSVEPTATSSLKKELKESLDILKKDFDALKHFVAELASDQITAPPSLTQGDLDDLLSVTSDIHDAANDIEFEANKIKETLSRFIG